jgi:uncharacterized protein DUF2442
MKFPVVREVKFLQDLRLHLVFEDGTSGEVELSDLRDAPGRLGEAAQPAMFPRVFVDKEAGTIAWPNGLDLDPLVLYSDVTGRSIDELLAALSAHTADRAAV